MCALDAQRVDFNIVEFIRIIEQLGYVVTWEKSAVCPCMPKEGSSQPDFNCPLCFGKGRYWFDPRTIKGVMTSFNERVQYNQTGEIVSGTSYFTTLGEYKLGFWDRITNFHSEIRYSEIVVKGDRNKLDRLRFKPSDVLSLRTVSTEYRKDIDFMYDAERQAINWLPTGLEPVRGERYSVEYLMHPRWIVIDLVNVVRDTYVKYKKPGIEFVPLPVRALVRLEFFVF